jgi:hypothetical protein
VVNTGHLGNSATSAQVVATLNTLSNNTNGGASPPLTFTHGQRQVPCDTIVTEKNGKFAYALAQKMVCAPASALAGA